MSDRKYAIQQTQTRAEVVEGYWLGKMWECVYQYAVQVGGVDHVTDRLDAFYKFAEVSHHVLPLDDLGVARKGRGQQSLVYQGLKAHHDGVVCRINRKGRTQKVNRGQASSPLPCEAAKAPSTDLL